MYNPLFTMTKCLLFKHAYNMHNLKNLKTLVIVFIHEILSVSSEHYLTIFHFKIFSLNNGIGNLVQVVQVLTRCAFLVFQICFSCTQFAHEKGQLRPLIQQLQLIHQNLHVQQRSLELYPCLGRHEVLREFLKVLDKDRQFCR